MRCMLICTLCIISIVNTYLHKHIAIKYITYIYCNIFRYRCKVKFEKNESWITRIGKGMEEGKREGWKRGRGMGWKDGKDGRGEGFLLSEPGFSGFQDYQDKNV